MIWKTNFDPLLRSLRGQPRIMPPIVNRQVVTLQQKTELKLPKPSQATSRIKTLTPERGKKEAIKSNSPDHALTRFDRPIYPIKLVND